jgi:cyclophilin family peptidyl-prolyl cis-trans isomerase
VPSDKRARQRAAREARLEAERKQHKRRQLYRNIAIVVVVAGVVVLITFLLTGNNSKKPVSADSKVSTTSTTAATSKADAALQAQANEAAVKGGCPASPTKRVNNLTWSSAPAMTIDTSKQYTATVKTTTGTFVIDLDATAAPKTVNNFVFLADKGYFNCGSFFRVIPGFVNQTGNPAQNNGGTEPGYTIPDELPPKAANSAQQYPLGSVVMANEGTANTGGSQFFIVAGPEGEQLPNTYALFGQVTTGESVVNTINQQGTTGGTPKVIQRMISVTINES